MDTGEFGVADGAQVDFRRSARSLRCRGAELRLERLVNGAAIGQVAARTASDRDPDGHRLALTRG